MPWAIRDNNRLWLIGQRFDEPEPSWGRQQKRIVYPDYKSAEWEQKHLVELGHPCKLVKI